MDILHVQLRAVRKYANANNFKLDYAFERWATTGLAAQWREYMEIKMVIYFVNGQEKYIKSHFPEALAASFKRLGINAYVMPAFLLEQAI